MTVKICCDAEGTILFSEGDVSAVYGIASLTKVWSAVLIFEILEQQRGLTSASFDAQPLIAAPCHYPDIVYSRMEPRMDLSLPDDPLSYRPFRDEKARFLLPVVQGTFYSQRALMEAVLFQSKNDAIQLLADSYFAQDDNRLFRKASFALANKLQLSATRIGDPHGLCDGDNCASALDLAKFYSYIVQKGYLDWFQLFDPTKQDHTARALFDDAELKDRDVLIFVAKTATGNDRRGNESAQSLMAIADVGKRSRIALTLSDPRPFETIKRLLLA